jgi:HEAT repeat protein
VQEIARRRLASGIPALAALCRRHAGFGRSKVIPQQKSAIEALGVIGGRAASQALARLIERGAFEGPGLTIALQEAIRMASPLSEPLVTNLLRVDDPGARAAAARCVRIWPRCVPALIELLQDLHEDVRLAAACALGRMGVGSARPILLNALREQPSREVVEAIAGIPDEEVLVLLGRTAQARQDIAELIRNVLDGIDHPLAARISARIRHLDNPGADPAPDQEASRA